MSFQYLQLHQSQPLGHVVGAVTKYRSRLHSNTLEALMCARSWLGDNMKCSHLELIFV